jgi:heme/copper-type cytochrome/quinol oxidase subunit 2
MNPLTRYWMFWLAATACAVAEAAIIISSVRSLRRSDGAKAAREAIWAVIPAIVLVWLLVATWAEVKRGSAHEQMNMPMPTSGA